MIVIVGDTGHAVAALGTALAPLARTDTDDLAPERGHHPAEERKSDARTHGQGAEVSLQRRRGNLAVGGIVIVTDTGVDREAPALMKSNLNNVDHTERNPTLTDISFLFFLFLFLFECSCY